jgi:rhodanese-related sulfurtransferase
MTKNLFKQIAIIILISTLLGLVWNLGSVKRYLKGEYEQGFLSSEEFSSIAFISFPEAEGLFATQEAVFIDSRSRGSFQKGHIQGAINIPFEESHDIQDGLLESLPHDKILVIYCDGQECQSSTNLARYLFQQGFLDLRVFFGGWEEWMKAGLPLGFEDDKK